MKLLTTVALIGISNFVMKPYKPNNHFVLLFDDVLASYKHFLRESFGETFMALSFQTKLARTFFVIIEENLEIHFKASNCV